MFSVSVRRHESEKSAEKATMTFTGCNQKEEVQAIVSVHFQSDNCSYLLLMNAFFLNFPRLNDIDKEGYVCFSVSRHKQQSQQQNLV